MPSSSLTVPDDAAPSLKKVEELFLESKRQGREKVIQNLHVFLPYAKRRFPCMRFIVIEALSFLEPTELAEHANILVALLSDMDNDVCYSALKAMNLLAPDVLAMHSDSISSLLKDEDYAIQLAALATLSNLAPEALVRHLSILRDCAEDGVAQIQVKATEIIAKVESELPRVVITVQPKQDNEADSCLVQCTSMSGISMFDVHVDRSTTCGTLRETVSQQLGLPCFQVELILDDATRLCDIAENTPLWDVLRVQETSDVSVPSVVAMAD